MAYLGQILSVAVTNPRQILKSEALLTKMAPGATILANTNRVQPGSFLTWHTSNYNFFLTKVGKITATSTSTVFYVGNAAPFAVGDVLKIGADSTTLTAVDLVLNKLTGSALSGGAPANGTRVASSTIGNNKVDCIALNDVASAAVDQMTEVSISGFFLTTAFTEWYHVDDIEGTDTASMTPAGTTTGLKAVLHTPFGCYAVR